MIGMKASLTVYEVRGVYYSTRYFGEKPGLLKRAEIREIFTISGRDADVLEEEAKREARKRNLTEVVNLGL